MTLGWLEAWAAVGPAGVPCAALVVAALLPAVRAAHRWVLAGRRGVSRPPSTTPDRVVVRGEPFDVEVGVHALVLGPRRYPWTAVRAVTRRGDEVWFDADARFVFRPGSAPDADVVVAACAEAMDRSHAPADPAALRDLRRLGPPPDPTRR